MLSLFQRKRVPPATSAPTPKPSAEPGKGLMRPEPAASLLATPRRQKLLEHIWQRTRCRAGSSPRCTSPRWNATPSWSSNSRVGGPSPRLSGRHAGPRPGDRRLRAQAAAVASAARRRHAGGASRQAEAWTAGTATRRCCMTSARSRSTCTSSTRTARSGTPGTARCGGRTASATAGSANTGCTAPPPGCSTPGCSIRASSTGSPAIPTSGPRCCTCWPASTSMPACSANWSCRRTRHRSPRNSAAIRARPWQRPGTHCSASCSMACATS